jgi:hypothetical protein
MDVVLLTLTILSLAAAAGFGALSWRVGREDRARARARMAALSTAMAPPSAEAPLLTGVAVGSVFDRPAEGLRGRPAIKLVAGVVMLLLIAGGVFLTSPSSGPARASVNAQGNQGRPLELLSMRHERQGTTLMVSGLVKNPPAGAAVKGVTAVVFAFDHTGAFVASGRAPLDFGALAPGDESPFVVNVPNVPDVSRYRVTFRSGTGVVRHIDRRANQVQLAQAVR